MDMGAPTIVPETAAIPAIISVTEETSKPKMIKMQKAKLRQCAYYQSGETKPPTKPKQIEIRMAKIFAKNNNASAIIS